MRTGVSAAFARQRHKLLALTNEELLRLNLEAEPFVDLLLAVVPRCRPRLAQLSRLPDFPPSSLADLKDYALILREANQRCTSTASAPPPHTKRNNMARARKLRT